MLASTFYLLLAVSSMNCLLQPLRKTPSMCVQEVLNRRPLSQQRKASMQKGTIASPLMVTSKVPRHVFCNEMDTIGSWSGKLASSNACTCPDLYEKEKKFRRRPLSNTRRDKTGSQPPWEGEPPFYPPVEQLRPCQSPSNDMVQLLKKLREKNDWRKEPDILTEIRRLTKHHSGLMEEKLGAICDWLASKLTCSTRPRIVISAANAVGELIMAFPYSIEMELDTLCKVLLLRLTSDNDKISKESEKVIQTIISCVQPLTTLAVLINTGSRHRHPRVRCKVARWMINIVVDVGSSTQIVRDKKIFSKLLEALWYFEKEGPRDIRISGRVIISILMKAKHFSEAVTQCGIKYMLPEVYSAQRKVENEIQQGNKGQRMFDEFCVLPHRERLVRRRNNWRSFGKCSSLHQTRVNFI